MKENEAPSIPKNNGYLFGFYIALATTVTTLITFGIAVTTLPLSGPFCQANCFEYPYLDIISRFPSDYFWMYPAMLEILLFVSLVVHIHYYADNDKRIFSLMGFAFSVISAAILFVDYFVQVSVVQPSLLAGETYGIPLITQFNPHGLFIALEDAGYLLMSIGFVCLAPVFAKKGKLENSIKWTFIMGFILTIGALVLITLLYGIHREYLFEVAVITINWFVLIIAGVLLSVMFRKRKGKG